MSEQNLSVHEQGLEVLKALRNLLADVQGTLLDHQKRINSINFLNDRLVLLHKLETEADIKAPE